MRSIRVSDLAVASVATLEVSDSLSEAAREMEDNTLAAVVVVDNALLVGIITERDLIRAAADNVPLDRTPIEEYMTVAPVTLPPAADAGEALRLMLEGGFRHIPVVDDEGEVSGLVTMRELARMLLGELVSADGRLG